MRWPTRLIARRAVPVRQPSRIRRNTGAASPSLIPEPEFNSDARNKLCIPPNKVKVKCKTSPQEQPHQLNSGEETHEIVTSAQLRQSEILGYQQPSVGGQEENRNEIK